MDQIPTTTKRTLIKVPTSNLKLLSALFSNKPSLIETWKDPSRANLKAIKHIAAVLFHPLGHLLLAHDVIGVLLV